MVQTRSHNEGVGAALGTESKSGDDLMASMSCGPIMCSLGGIPYNNEHIEYWKRRVLYAEAKINGLADAMHSYNKGKA